MGEVFNSLDQDIQDQIKVITKNSGVDYSEESLELMSKAWVDKKEIFEKEINELQMEECDFFDINDEKGALIMTYSGSLVNIGPLRENKRKCEYTSIGLRLDVPDSAVEEESVLLNNIEVDSILEFDKGPVKSTSSIFKIAVFKEKLDPDEEEEKLSSATIVIADGFADINKTIIEQ